VKLDINKYNPCLTYTRALLADIKKSQNLSVQAIAQKIGVGSSTVADYKSGRTKPSYPVQFALETLAHQDKIDIIVSLSIQIMAGIHTIVPITRDDVINAAREHPLCKSAANAHNQGDDLPLHDLVCRIVQCRVAKHLYPDLWEKMGYME
jgi:transcriptional regulator with XRE-family HTH domain